MSVPAAPQLDDPQVLRGARRAVERYGWQDVTLDRIAAEAGLSRMTLHRRGVSRAAVLDALAAQLEREYRDAMWPALAAPGSGRERLERALAAECEVAEANLRLLGALSEGPRAAIFHDQDARGLTRGVFTAPLQRLLADGAADGSLRPVDGAETATVLFSLVGFTYRHLRQGHGWAPARARRAVLSIALEGVAA
jgi:AcrR family transcriptional regulator